MRELLTGGRRWFALTAIGLVVVGLLVATVSLRGDDDRAQAAPKQQLTQVDIRPPGREPVIEPEAQQPTEAGATAFALYWFDALNWSLARNDTDLLAGSTNAGCPQCTAYLINIQKWKDRGATLQGGLSIPLDLAIGPFDISQPVQFASTFLTTPATLTERDGTATDYAGGRTKGGLTVLWANGRWQMTDVVIDVSKAPATP